MLLGECWIKEQWRIERKQQGGIKDGDSKIT